MLVIRKEQREAFDRAQRRSFEDRMVAHLRKYFPEETEMMRESQLRHRIRQEIETAARYDIVDERDVAVYISVMFALMPDPSRDPEPSWVKEVLNDPDLIVSEKIDRLQHWAEEELKERERAPR
jgi:hypothetical protein